jgi:hypothetical protein
VDLLGSLFTFGFGSKEEKILSIENPRVVLFFL